MSQCALLTPAPYSIHTDAIQTKYRRDTDRPNRRQTLVNQGDWGQFGAMPGQRLTMSKFWLSRIGPTVQSAIACVDLIGLAFPLLRENRPGWRAVPAIQPCLHHRLIPRQLIHTAAAHRLDRGHALRCGGGHAGRPLHVGADCLSLQAFDTDDKITSAHGNAMGGRATEIRAWGVAGGQQTKCEKEGTTHAPPWAGHG